ncbi:MAG: endonuclease NucS domain-containing protein [Alphaproteobacteria bacterium]
MKQYYRLMLGQKSMYAEQCFAGSYVGVNFGITQNLNGHLPEAWRQFNAQFIPAYQAAHAGKSKVAAGLACGALWTVAKGMQEGDVVLCPDGKGKYRVGEICGAYIYEKDTDLPHRRPVRWFEQAIDRADMSEALRYSTGSIGTISKITSYADEIVRFMGGGRLTAQPLEATEEAVAFALEKHLEDFLVQNWKQTELGKDYDIYEVDGEMVGQQYATDTGPLDILAISKDKKILLVVELKKGRPSDAVVGQVLRYMGYVQEELAESTQMVRGVIIAQENDVRLQRALSMVPQLDFYQYEIRFKLSKPQNNKF